MQELVNRTPDQLEGDEYLILGGTSYFIDKVQWNVKRQRWVVSYRKEGTTTTQLLMCKANDLLTVFVPHYRRVWDEAKND
jgi:hypothetical protein